MQYLKLVIDTKTTKKDQTFTYLGPPESLPFLKKGQLVKVPFRKKIKLGIVLGFTWKAPPKKEIKKISEILTSEPLLTEELFDLGLWLSQYYGSTLSQAFFTIIPPLPLSKKKFHDRRISRKQKKLKNGKIYSFFGREMNRLGFYRKLIKKAISKNKDIIILFPTIPFSFFRGLSKISFQSLKLSQRERFDQWHEILVGRKKIVAGVRSAVFAPLPNLGLIIIDKSDHFTYKEERIPCYHSLTVAKKRSKKEGLNLVIGSDFPDLETYQKIKNKEYRLLTSLPSIPDGIRIIDTQRQKGWISFQLEEAIRNSLARKEKIILFLNRKGLGQMLICQDCGFVWLCPNCEKTLPVYQNELICHTCNYKTPLPLTCPLCQGVSLKNRGLGILRLKEIVKKLFPTTSIRLLEEKGDFDILITTKKILDHSFYLKNRPWGKIILGIISIDLPLSLPNYRSNEEVFLTILRLSCLANNSIIQTNFPNHFVFQAIKERNLDYFFQTELKIRKENDLPPFAQLIKLVYEHSNDLKAEAQAEALFQKINLGIRNWKLEIEALGPSPCFFHKIRGKYRWQIIIKLKRENKKVKTKLFSLVPSDWKIDVDPISLL